MLGRRLSLLRPFRKKKEGPGTTPAQQSEEVEQFQPLQEDPGQNQTQEQDRARGRFRRTVQGFLKMLGVRRRKYRITPTEVMAQPDPMPAELKADPDVGTVSIDGTANCDTAVTDHVTNSNTALPELTMEADGATTEGIADADSTPIQRLPDALILDILDEGVISVEETMDQDRDMERRPPRVPKLAWVKKGEEESPGAAPALQPKKVEQFQPLQEDPGQHQTKEQDRARGRFHRTDQVPAAIPPWDGPAVTAQSGTTVGAFHGTSLSSLPFVLLQRLQKSVPVRRRKTRASPTEVLAKPELNPTKLKAKVDAPETEGIPDADSTPIQRLSDARSVHVLEKRVVSVEVSSLWLGTVWPLKLGLLGALSL
ncbi:uncharacterized protein LOC113941693 [Corapipo altera]|uniref:uncharacterized protein LOC113941693 n=1 Tax=Corapipo altera TaxID=415028 RepID=UPI000FD64FC6|nr:uncharacterized protein LOC113941693 [Corapipo altera]